MATVRCEDHKPRSLVRPYAAAVKPVGWPGSIACQAGACRNPGLLWLTAKEKADYDGGERVFRAAPDRVRAQ